jgi:hypothetical protein
MDQDLVSSRPAVPSEEEKFEDEGCGWRGGKGSRNSVWRVKGQELTISK